ncbi:MAG: hypothetical protein WA324_08260 [Bryobacteraceae bacterium]
MFDVLLWSGIIIAIAGMIYAFDGSKDVFHPLIYISPMLLFAYGWMPIRLQSLRGLEGYFQMDQLVFVQFVYVLGILAFVLGCLSIPVRLDGPKPTHPSMDDRGRRILFIGGCIVAMAGFTAWFISILNVGGIQSAFGRPYSGGWDDSGYIRDASLFLFAGVSLILASTVDARMTLKHVIGLAFFISPLLLQAVFTARRGPTFMILVTVGMGWFFYKGRRPPIITTLLAGALGGYLILFIVANRQSLYMGSDFDFKTDVSNITESSDTGNEYIYGAGSLLSAEQRGRYFWGRRYLAQILVRPIPRAVWPTKYTDFGVPELEHNAGTGEGFADALGWEGAAGSAPTIIADLWLEFRWLCIPALWLIGRAYGYTWNKARRVGGVWTSQYIILASLSIYLVMQTMEAVIFRVLMLSLPVWFVWRKARTRAADDRRATRERAFLQIAELERSN